MTDLLVALLLAALLNHLLLARSITEHAPLRRLHARSSALIIALSLPLAWGITQLLSPLALPYLFLLSFAICAGALAWLIPKVFNRQINTAEHQCLWPLLCANGIAAMLAGYQQLDAINAMLLSPLACLGFMVALLLIGDLQQRINTCDVPSAFRGAPVMLISAGLSAMALLGLNGIVTP